MSTKKALTKYLLFSVIALLTAGVVFAIELFFYPQHTLGDSVAIYIAFNGMLLSLSVISIITLLCENDILLKTKIIIFVISFLLSPLILKLIFLLPSTFLIESLFPHALFFSENRNLLATLFISLAVWVAYFIIYLIVNFKIKRDTK